MCNRILHDTGGVSSHSTSYCNEPPSLQTAARLASRISESANLQPCPAPHECWWLKLRPSCLQSKHSYLLNFKTAPNFFLKGTLEAWERSQQVNHLRTSLMTWVQTVEPTQRCREPTLSRVLTSTHMLWDFVIHIHKCKNILSYQKTTFVQIKKFKNIIFWAWEMAQWLRAPAALPEDPGSLPSNHIAAHNCLWLQSGRSNAFFWPPQTSGMCIVQTYMQTKHSSP